MTKILPLLPALPSLTNRSLLLKRVGYWKSGQCITILDWLSEHAEVSFGLIREITECPSRHALCHDAEESKGTQEHEDSLNLFQPVLLLPFCRSIIVGLRANLPSQRHGV